MLKLSKNNKHSSELLANKQVRQSYSHDVNSEFIINADDSVLSHTCTVVRECCKGDDESLWEREKFDHPPPKNPLTDGHQNLYR